MTTEINALPPIAASEPNDAIPFAVDTQLSESNSTFKIRSSINYEDANRYANADGTFRLIDATEDVDLYKVELKAGDTIKVDLDSRQLVLAGELPVGIDAQLRVFDAAGTELNFSDDTPAPGEAFLSEVDPYLEFTAAADGSYYVGVSIFNNRSYDPLVPGSGSGSTSFTPFTFVPLTTGEYVLNIDLNSDAQPAATVIPDSTGTGATVSLQSLVAAYNVNFSTGNYSIIAPAAVENLETGNSALVLALQVDGEIPAGGLEVFVNSDSDITELFVTNPDSGNNLAYLPFSSGGQVLSPIIDATGRTTGFKVRVEEPNAVISLPIRDDGVANEPKDISFFVEPAAGYQINTNEDLAAITIYDTLDQVPAVTVTPEVSFTANKTALVESAGDAIAFTFSLSEAPPPEGVVVLVQANAANPFAAFNAIADFDFSQASAVGGVFPIDNPASSGFYFKITDQIAALRLPIAEDGVSEGIEAVTFALAPGSGYSVDPDATATTLTITDTPESQIQVSLSTEPAVLIESEGTVSVHTFTLSATPPPAGVAVSVDVPNLSEFALNAIAITGGNIVENTDTGFLFNITAQEAVISLPVAADEITEGLEEVSLTLAAGEGYQIDPTANSGTLTIADTPDQLPLSETETNDTIPLAFTTGLSADRNTLSISGEISAHSQGAAAVDASEDVDFYSFELQAGNAVALNVDAVGYQIPGLENLQQLDANLRLFNADGEELSSADDAPLIFTATTAGTYYLGVGQTGNTAYDPFTAGSGSGRIDPSNGINTGAYTLNLAVSPPPPGDLLDLRSYGDVVVDILDKQTQAGFINVVGFYKIEDTSGTVIDPITGSRVAPGDGRDYTLAAVRRSQVAEEGISFGIRDSEAVVANLKGGSLYAPFIIANSTVEQVLSSAILPDVFFDFVAANGDGVDHVKQPIANQFAFEDLRGGGDFNFTDAVFSVQVQSIV